MKLFRTDLEKLFSNQLFEISTDDLDLNGFNIADKKLRCTISVEVAASGYRIHGNLNTKIKVSCDRCLTKFNENLISNINIILSNDNDLINDKNIDVVKFSDSDDFVDLTFIIRDHILLTEPFQRLCSKDCKGLCLKCGDNMNITNCNCNSTNTDNRWASLKKIIDKKN